MSNTLKALDELCDVLTDALTRDDWDRIVSMDDQFRRLCEKAVAEARAGDLDVQAVKERLDHMQFLYQGAREKAVRSRDQAQAALKQLGKTHRAASSYIANSLSEPKGDKSG